MYKTNNYLAEQGFSLIEILIGSSLSLFLLTILLNEYIEINKYYQKVMSTNEFQMHAITAIEMLRREIHLAGYIGCAKLNSDFSVKAYEDFKLSATNKCEIDEVNSRLTLRHLSLENVSLAQPMKNYHTMHISKELKISAGNILLIADCQQAEIFRVFKVREYLNYNLIITTRPLQKLYNIDAVIGFYEINTFYVSETKQKQKNGSPIFGLFEKNIQNEKVELLKNVDRINFNLVGSLIKTKILLSNSNSIYKALCFSAGLP